MCGIAGVAGCGPPRTEMLAGMAAKMIHRGPDSEGFWSDETVGFAFRRLAIIDLDERSNQPLHFEHWHLVFNGEIYNYRELREELRTLGHRFRTEGDGEVLLHAWAEWGPPALDRLNGMFAFAVWDERDKSLVLAADPFGEKPLYYHRSGSRMIFASDIPALLSTGLVPAEPNEEVLGAYVARGLMPDPQQSFFRNIERLPAAHVLRWTPTSVSLRRYWSPRRQQVPRDYADCVGALRELLADSVRLRLRSDVAVGTSLSGGVDSSAVVAIASKMNGDGARHGFTARFPGFERDEWPFAQEVARASAVTHSSVAPTGDELLADLEPLVRDHQEPVVSSSVYAQWRVMALAKEHGVVVLLDGQGGDEIFAGYDGVSGWALRARGAGGLAGALARRPADGVSVARSLAVDHLPSALARRHFARTSSPYAGGEVIAAAATLDPRRASRALPRHGADPLRRELLAQGFVTILPQLLRYADRSSMAHSREVRLPLLDRRIVELAYSLPARFLHDGRRSKRILRDAVAGLVPASVLARRDKVGFETPQRSWLSAAPMRAAIGELLLDGPATGRGLYDARAIERDIAAEAWRSPDAIWRALNAEVWLRTLADRVAPGTTEPPRAGDAALASAGPGRGPVTL